MAAVLVILLGTFVVTFAVRGLPPAIRRLAWLCYLAHLAGAAAQVWLHTDYYGGGDMFTYMRNGAPIVRLVESDPVRWGPEWLRLLLHIDNELPHVHGAGSTSGTMVAIAAAMVYVFGGPLPVWEVCLVCTISSTLGQIWMCKAAISTFEEQWHKSVAIGALLVPSVIFWSSALMKEAIALPFLAILLASTVALAKRRWLRGIAGVAVGAVGLGLVKGYILMPFVLSVATAAYVARNARSGAAGRKVGWPYAIAGVVGSVVALAAISVALPQYAPGSLAENTAKYQQTYENLETIGQGGSNVELSDDLKDLSLAGQLKIVPLATVNALFRPMFFEARSVVQLAASFETLAVVILLIRLLRFGPAQAMAGMKRSPALAFCAVFVITFAIAVGLSTLNLGTLSRYRIPMMPFFTVLLFVLGQQAKRAVASGAVVEIPGRAQLRLAAARNRERILAQRRGA